MKGRCSFTWNQLEGVLLIVDTVFETSILLQQEEIDDLREVLFQIDNNSTIPSDKEDTLDLKYKKEDNLS